MGLLLHFPPLQSASTFSTPAVSTNAIMPMPHFQSPHSTFCTVEANYWQTRSIARPLCDSWATCSLLVSMSMTAARTVRFFAEILRFSSFLYSTKIQRNNKYFFLFSRFFADGCRVSVSCRPSLFALTLLPKRQPTLTAYNVGRQCWPTMLARV